MAFIGSWVEQIGSIVESEAALRVGIVTSLVMPVESLWRRTAYVLQGRPWNPSASSARLRPSHPRAPRWSAMASSTLASPCCSQCARSAAAICRQARSDAAHHWPAICPTSASAADDQAPRRTLKQVETSMHLRCGVLVPGLSGGLCDWVFLHSGSVPAAARHVPAELPRRWGGKLRHSASSAGTIRPVPGWNVPAHGAARPTPARQSSLPPPRPAVHRARRPQPAEPASCEPRRTRARQGRSRALAACGKPLHGAASAASAGWGRRRARDTQQGQAAAFVSSLRCARSAFINGGGCAASLINQWKRLRRSEYLGGPNGRFQHGHAHAGCWCATRVLTPMPAAEAGRLGAALSADFAAVRRSFTWCVSRTGADTAHASTRSFVRRVIGRTRCTHGV